MKVRFWGVRGSIPVPGADTSRYGGNTSCVELQSDEGPPLVLDCGTGGRALGRDLVLRREPEVQLLLSHFHMDHLFGFPFFSPLYTPNCRVSVALPAYSDVDARSMLGRYMNGIYHPVRIRDFAATIRFFGVRIGRAFEVGPYRVQPVNLNHPGGSTGYRITDGRTTVTYLTDTAPLAQPGEGLTAGKPPPGPEERVLAAAREADLVIMDTMFSWEEYLDKMTWGHGYPEYAVRLCEEAGARRLALFHHAPDATDEVLDVLAERWAAHEDQEVFLAREGVTVDLEG